MHVDPMKPLLKAPVTKRLKLKCDELLSSFAFKFNLRRYIEIDADKRTMNVLDIAGAEWEARKAGAYTRPTFSSTKASLVSEPYRVQINLSQFGQ